MKIKNIRQSVFETNSSSTHCIVINKEDAFLIDDSYKTCINRSNDKIEFTLDGEYGWHNEKLINLSEKLSYIFCCILDTKLNCIFTDDIENEKQSKLELRKTQINQIEQIYDDINDLVYKTTGYEIYCENYNELVSKVKMGIEDYETELSGYVDHADTKYFGIVDPLLNNKEDLHKFLFDSKSVLYMTNDNRDNEGTEYDFDTLNYQYYGGN